MEADYSNYDRYMPVDIFLFFVSQYLSNKPNKQYWFDICSFLHHGIAMIWPDYIQRHTLGTGYIFLAKVIGLLSGLKITSEEGTFVNLIVNIQALLDGGKHSESELFDYLTYYLHEPPGSRTELVDIQSDDTLLKHNNLKSLLHMAAHFKTNADLAGIKGSIEIGERFLMRMMLQGADSPVPYRVFQNTISNEESVVDILKFAVGFAIRTDGLLGHKTYDPFHTGQIREIQATEIMITHETLLSLGKFLRTSSVPNKLTVEVLDLLITASTRMMRQIGLYGKKVDEVSVSDLSLKVKMNGEDASHLDKARKELLRRLAVQEQEKISLDPYQTMIGKLMSDRNNPSSKYLLDEITALAPSLASTTTAISQKEYKFFRFALNKVGIPLHL